jgi:undecaprenyl diphosphate synthase
MHVAIIMDGNGQRAMQRGLPSTAGGTAGATALRTTVALAAAAGVTTLTLYAILNPSETRPRYEIDADLGVLDHFLGGSLRWCREQAVRVSLIGQSEPLTWLLPSLSDHNRHLNVTGSRLHLRIVVDYSAHDSLITIAWPSAEAHAPEEFFRQLAEIDPTALPAGAVDLLIRTGGGGHLSDFMLWEVAYAQLHFVGRSWPDFTSHDFQQGLDLLLQAFP